MYEEWTYAVSGPEPETVKTAAIEQAAAQTGERPVGSGPGRPRRKSLVRKVALEQHRPKQPVEGPAKAQTKPRRAKSLCERQINKPKCQLRHEHPFTPDERDKLLDNSEWIKDEKGDVAWPDDDPLVRSEDALAQELWLRTYAQAAACTKALSSADRLSQLLDGLCVGLGNVENDTLAFKDTCDALVTREHWLDELHAGIDRGLRVYDALDRATRRLAAPGSDIVRGKEFQALLADLDQGIAFFAEHPDFVDADLYAMKYRQCMTRALSLCHEYFTSRVRNLQASVAADEARIEKQAGAGSGVLGEATRQALLYGKFEDDAPILQPVANEIASRAQDHDEYAGLLDQCVRAYCGVRNKLLGPMLAQQAAQTAMSSSSGQTTPGAADASSGGGTTFVQACVRSLTFYRDLFDREARLFGLFFDVDACRDELQNWLMDLSEPLHDSLRQRIIRETEIASLCELITVLLPYVDDTTEHDELVNLALLFNPILKDVQYRLVFRTQQTIDRDIARYVPQPDDLAQVGHRRKKSSVGQQPSPDKANGEHAPPVADQEQSKYQFDTTAIVEGWYPPLRTAVTILSQIYQLINSSIFDDLAHRILHESIGALNKVSEVAQSRLGAMEAQLFLMKQLLVLRAQIVEFDIEAAPTEVQVDFSGLAGVISRIRTEGVQLNSSSILNLARESVPKVVNNMLDAKAELYAQLKNAIHSFTEHAVKAITKSIIQDPKPSTAVEDTRRLRQETQQELPRIRNVIRTYISDDRTVDILIDSIEDLVIQTYEAYYDKMVATAKSPDEIDGMMDVDGLVSWLGDVVSSMYRENETNAPDGPDGQ